ncbi:MAG: YcxB family protein [Lachnospiraceae bacterium]|nr:YcxB family protein [Lachnospiraceae bacterium]
MEEKELESNDGLKITANMSTAVLYDYMVHHSYTSAEGILGTCFGVLGLIIFAKTQYPLYLLIGLVLIFYLPVNLRYRAALAMHKNPAFKKPLEYSFGREGFTVRQGEESGEISWDKCTKAVSTRLSIVIYTGKKNASILPRKDIGDDLGELISCISEHMDQRKIRIRF